VWKVLGAVKHEFGKFGGVLDKVKRQLDTAGRTLEETGVRTRAMERKLRSVEALPADAATEMLELSQESPVDLLEASKEDGVA
jgi:DNA recombination protein RmuC